MTQPIDPRERLIVPLDVASHAEALALVDDLGDAVVFYKVGFELLLAGDHTRLIRELLSRDRKIFLDLKLFDIPATVAAAVRQVARAGVHFVTVHGNDAMLRAAASAKGATLKVLAVTALTSLDRGDLDDLGFDCDVEQLVLSRARRALAVGCDGVVSSGLEVHRIKHETEGRVLVVTPGIRPVQNDDDQKRVVTPSQALRSGADYLVVGRPIREAGDPRAAAEAIQQEIAEAVRQEIARGLGR
jgi:orotidine-5'-phosphate decarboxylase